MCYAILKISYRASSEPNTLLEIEHEVEYKRKLDEVLSRPEVTKVTIFFPHETHQTVQKWEVVDHVSNTVTEATRVPYPYDHPGY